MDRCVTDVKPALIFNCAVLQVDESEQNPDRAKASMSTVRGFWLKRRAKTAPEIVHFSTQYAFAGEPVGRPPYTIDRYAGGR